MTQARPLYSSPQRCGGELLWTVSLLPVSTRPPTAKQAPPVLAEVAVLKPAEPPRPRTSTRRAA